MIVCDICGDPDCRKCMYCEVELCQEHMIHTANYHHPNCVFNKEPKTL